MYSRPCALPTHGRLEGSSILIRFFRAALLTTLLYAGATGLVQAADFGADRHVARGVKCEACHGPKMQNEYPDEKACLSCHNRNDIAKKTGKLNPNPHRAPHNGDCTLCHMQHEPEVNYCEQCHQFGFEMPHGAQG